MGSWFNINQDGATEIVQPMKPERIMATDKGGLPYHTDLTVADIMALDDQLALTQHNLEELSLIAVNADREVREQLDEWRKDFSARVVDLRGVLSAHNVRITGLEEYLPDMARAVKEQVDSLKGDFERYNERRQEVDEINDNAVREKMALMSRKIAKNIVEIEGKARKEAADRYAHDEAIKLEINDVRQDLAEYIQRDMEHKKELIIAWGAVALTAFGHITWRLLTL